MYNKLCNKQYGLFSSSISYLHEGQYHQTSFSKHKNHLISSSHAHFMVVFLFLILFHNVNNFFKVPISYKGILNSYNKK
jgi:hypothetical protein